ncbi:hypothetical protein ISN44_As13g018450 [Arabidopsis suecica]|uniref:Uncharacterized protein n=1 Tax=Arabidopsis suecica TaxID=45249 RepID=A0A8T1XV59_ARASU|nr:hypothetical protein ISN44_As13g018450 [Arabidopsis suecica]
MRFHFLLVLILNAKQKKLIWRLMDHFFFTLLTLMRSLLTSIMGKQRISEGKKESKVLEDEISYLVEKLNELKSPKVKDMEARNFRHNIDKQASVLRRELEKFDEAVSEEICVKGMLCFDPTHAMFESIHLLMLNV